jgi:hypothetical protein
MPVRVRARLWGSLVIWRVIHGARTTQNQGNPHPFIASATGEAVSTAQLGIASSACDLLPRNSPLPAAPSLGCKRSDAISEAGQGGGCVAAAASLLRLRLANSARSQRRRRGVLSIQRGACARHGFSRDDGFLGSPLAGSSARQKATAAGLTTSSAATGPRSRDREGCAGVKRR